jgi:hypothetical protein
LPSLTCPPLAFAEALAQAGTAMARLLESYGEQAGGSVAISLAKFQIPKSNLQTNPCKMQTVKMKMQNDRATVNKKLKCKKQRCKQRYTHFKF